MLLDGNVDCRRSMYARMSLVVGEMGRGKRRSCRVREKGVETDGRVVALSRRRVIQLSMRGVSEPAFHLRRSVDGNTRLQHGIRLESGVRRIVKLRGVLCSERRGDEEPRRSPAYSTKPQDRKSRNQGDGTARMV